MRWVKVETLSEQEEKIRWYLQDKYDTMKKYNHNDISCEWNEAMLFANFLTEHRWAVVNGSVSLMKCDK